MMKYVSLESALEIVASPDEWAEFRQLVQQGHAHLLFYVIGDEPDPHMIANRRFEKLLEKLWSEVKGKIQDGLWVIEGFRENESQPQLIAPALLNILQPSFDRSGLECCSSSEHSAQLAA